MNEIINSLKIKQRKVFAKKRITLNLKVKISENFLFNTLNSFDWFKESRIIATFLSIKTEIPTENFNRLIENSGKNLCLPVMSCEKNDPLKFIDYSDGDYLTNGPYGVKEPIGDNICLPDIIFTPCLAYDEFGYRLGYGGGYYDKTISFLNSINHKFLTIGLAYHDQKVKNIAHDKLDQKLNYVLTEKRLYEFV